MLNNLSELRRWIFQQKEQYPSLANAMQEFLDLCITEIEDGASVTHEINLCVDSVSDLVDTFRQENDL